MKVIVTGGAGFIGSHLVDRLVREDYDVVVFSNCVSVFQLCRVHCYRETFYNRIYAVLVRRAHWWTTGA